MDAVLPMDRQVFSCLQESKTPAHVAVNTEDKLHHSEQLPSSSFPSALCAEHDVSMVWVIPLVSQGQLSCVPSQLLVDLQPPCG